MRVLDRAERLVAEVARLGLRKRDSLDDALDEVMAEWEEGEQVRFQELVKDSRVVKAGPKNKARAASIVAARLQQIRLVRGMRLVKGHNRQRHSVYWLEAVKGLRVV